MQKCNILSYLFFYAILSDRYFFHRFLFLCCRYPIIFSDDQEVCQMDIFQDSSRYFHISAFYALSLPYYHMEHHTHSSYEIMYITSGSCRVFCMDEEQDIEFPLKSGQFIFIHPDIPHRLETRWFSLLDPESGIFPHFRRKPGSSGTSSEKRSRIFPVLELYGLLTGILLRHGLPEFRIQPERPSHLFAAQFR